MWLGRERIQVIEKDEIVLKYNWYGSSFFLGGQRQEMGHCVHQRK